MVVQGTGDNNLEINVVDQELDFKSELDAIFSNTLIKWHEKFVEYKHLAEKSTTREEYNICEKEFRKLYYTEKIHIFDQTFKIFQKVSHSNRPLVSILLNIAAQVVLKYKLKQNGDDF